MSFSTLKKEELLRTAAHFEVPEVSEDNTKAEILAALEEAEVSWSNYKKFVAPKEDVDEFSRQDDGVTSATEKFEEMVLLKMTRANGTFEIRGHKFTREQPFKLLSAGEAQEVIDQAERIGGGFRIASPAEAKSFFA